MTDRNELLRDLEQIPSDEDGPVFSAPWEAATFALAVRLSQEGHFSWAEWAETLAQEIAEAQRQGDSDLGNTYYHHWASALERLCAEKGLAGRPEIDRRTADWRRAYLNTPHGKPVELAAAYRHTPRAE